MEQRLARHLRQAVEMLSPNGSGPAFELGKAAALLAEYDKAERKFPGGWHYPADPEKGWVESELPPRLAPVEATFTEGVVYIASWEGNIGGVAFWNSAQHYTTLEAVIAWRELPAPAQRRA